MIKTNGNELSKYKYIDLFCGIGGFHIALSSFGAECVFASDIDKNSQDIYEKNFGIRPHGDIKKIECNDIPKHDILCAGFPCQPFSISGNQQGFNDETGNGRLFFEIIRIAKFHEPKIILLENVRNLEYHDNGKTLDTIKNELDSIGYYVFYKTLNTSNFKIPQARKRLYIVALKKSLKIKEFNFPIGDNDLICLEDILLDDYEISDNLIVNRKWYLNNNVNDDMKIGIHNKLIKIGNIGLGRQGERIYSVTGHAITLSSQSGGLGGQTGMYYINGKIRKLHPRECARLMGFPDNYILPDSIRLSYLKLGNSVVVDVLQYIVKKIIESLRGAK